MSALLLLSAGLVCSKASFTDSNASSEVIEGTEGQRSFQIMASGKQATLPSKRTAAAVQTHGSNSSVAAVVLRREPQDREIQNKKPSNAQLQSDGQVESKYVRATIPHFFPPDVLLQQCDRTKICQCNLEHEIGGLLLGDYHQCNANGDMVPLSVEKQAEFSRVTDALDSNVNDCDQWQKLVCCSKAHCDEAYSLAKQGCEEFKQNLYPECGFDCSGEMCPADSMTNPVAYRLQVVTRVVGVRTVNMLVLCVAALIGVMLTSFMPFARQAPPHVPETPQLPAATEAESKS